MYTRTIVNPTKTIYIASAKIELIESARYQSNIVAISMKDYKQKYKNGDTLFLFFSN